MRREISPEGDAERTAYAATRLENGGDLAQARERWSDLKKHKEVRDPELRPWGLLAEKRLGEIQAAEQWEKELTELIYQARSGNREIQADSAKERQAALALNAELFGDLALASDSWEKLKTRFQDDQDQRPRIFLAAKKIRDLKTKVVRGAEEMKVRRELLAKKVQEAMKLQEERPPKARVIFRDIVNLYSATADPEIAKFVAQAQKLLK